MLPHSGLITSIITHFLSGSLGRQLTPPQPLASASEVAESVEFGVAISRHGLGQAI